MTPTPVSVDGTTPAKLEVPEAVVFGTIRTNTEEPHMTVTVHLSEAALELLRLRLSGDRTDVTPDNLESYRELAIAGIMYPMSGFIGGKEASFRFTREGWEGREQWVSVDAVHPS